MQVLRGCKRELSSEDLAAQPLPKRRHQAESCDTVYFAPSCDVVSTMSDELLLRIFSYVNERALLDLSPVSKRFRRISSDSHLWRTLYFRRFILPRALRSLNSHSSESRRRDNSIKRMDYTIHRVGGVSNHDTTAVIIEDRPDCRLKSVDWKRRYKICHNWANGICALNELLLTEPRVDQISGYQTLVKVVDGLVVTAEEGSGLRLWDIRNRTVLAGMYLRTAQDTTAPPTCLALDNQCLHKGVLRISVGFEDGSFSIFLANIVGKQIFRQFHHSSRSGSLTAIAYSYPYLLSATISGLISIYSFDDVGWKAPDGDFASDDKESRSEGCVPFTPPRKLIALKSQSTRMPVALSIRRTAKAVIASVVHTFDTFGGWAVGMQDLFIEDPKPQVSQSARIVGSRIASTLPVSTIKRRGTRDSRFRQIGPTACGSQISSTDGNPVQLSYSHPYLLATLCDNTMFLFLCTSTATSLSLSAGRRLWGHTSSISDAEITPRGRAVSVSSQGNEIRLWQLDGRSRGDSVSVKVRGRSDDDGAGNGHRSCSKGRSKKWKCVGFDEEAVVVLNEYVDGRESLMVHDFT